MEIKIINMKLEFPLNVNAMDLVGEVMTQISLNLKISVYRLELIYNNLRLEKYKNFEGLSDKGKGSPGTERAERRIGKEVREAVHHKDHHKDKQRRARNDQLLINQTDHCL
jgi:hypothetical protein